MFRNIKDYPREISYYFVVRMPFLPFTFKVVNGKMYRVHEGVEHNSRVSLQEVMDYICNYPLDLVFRGTEKEYNRYLMGLELIK